MISNNSSKTLKLILLTCVVSMTLSATENKDIFKEQIHQYHTEMSQAMKRHVAENQKHMMHLAETTEHKCTGGQNPDDMTHGDYLEAFAAGPCNPAIFIPGIAGSKLRAVIDCPILRSNNPTLFESCGWKSCDGRSGPDSEYIIWIPDPLSPMSMITPLKKTRDCFTGIISLDSQFDEDGKIIFIEKRGVHVAPIGETDETQHSSECGFDSITFLV
jgi:hypothetical protein